jgi:hypothetical protein
LTDVYGDAGYVIFVEFDFAAVQAGSNFKAECVDLVANRTSAADRSAWPVEGRQYTVAGGLHLSAPEPFQLPFDDSVVTAEKLPPTSVTPTGRLPGRVDDIGEQYRS